MEAPEGSRALALLLAALLLACAAAAGVGADPCVRGASVGYNFTIAVLDDDSLMWWGLNPFVGVATGNRIASLPSMGDILSASAGRRLYCALRRNGTVYCGGDGANFDMSGLTDVTSISAGEGHMCAVDKWGKVYCVGGNEVGELGTGDTQDRTTPTLVEGLDARAIAVSAGWYHTCVLVDDGGATAVKCFGANDFGELGNGDPGHDSYTPVVVKDLELHVQSISAGGIHTCVLMADSTVRCFGDGQVGQLGRGNHEGSAVPVPVPGLSGVVAIAASAAHTCALLSDATVACWGKFGYQPGTFLSPTAVPGLIGVRSLSPGSMSHMACAMLLNGGLSCWGEGFLGGEGDDWQDSNTYAPVTVQGLSGCSVGPPGDTGPQGPTGFQGPEGFQGPSGAQGPAGLQGAPGPEGPSGAAGAQGPGGFQGPTGFRGPEGPQGLAGTQGDRGAAGTQGAAGLPGPEGPQGLVGVQGDRGAVGAQGATGFWGPEGPQGLAGAQGDPGVKGSRGPAGPTGFQGSAGFQGPAGIPGSTGVQGPAGAQGLKGSRGDNLGNRLVAVLPRNMTLTVSKQVDSTSLPCPAGTQPVFATWKPSTDAGGSTSLWGATCNAWISPSEARALGSCSFRCRIALIISSAGSPVAASAPKMLPTTTATAELLCLCINTLK